MEMQMGKFKRRMYIICKKTEALDIFKDSAELY